MQKKYTLYLLSFLVLASLIAGIFGANFAFAKQQHASSTQAKQALGSAISSNTGVPHVVNMRNVQAATAKQLHQQQPLLPLYPGGSTKYATIKAGAAHNAGAPVVAHPFPATSGVTQNTPPAITAFPGMADSATICPYFGGCQPPDMAIATSNQWVLQHVNDSVAVYNTSGSIQPGWPKNSQNFFSVPNPSPSGCDPAGPFLSDPRAFYDPNTGRFWTAELQVENAFGIAPNCNFLSGYWIAVSQTSDPNGSWNVYFFDMALGNPNAADYTQFGFDAKNIYFSGNMFPVSTGNFYAQIMGVNKTRMENGQSVTAYGFRNLISPLDGSVVDTVQPVETEALSNGVPPVGLFINSTNGNCSTTTCSGMTIWGIHNPGTASESLNAVYVPTTSYAFAPNADQPTCIQCVETIDLRITATPVYHDGLITFAIDTGIANTSGVDVPGIFWGEVHPQIVNQFLTGGFIYQSGYFSFSGDQAASFGALMPDNNGNLIMVYDTMSSTLNPSIAYAGRRATYSLGQFHDAGRFLKVGNAPTLDTRWGDFEATSYDGPGFDHIWIASQYSGVNQDWHTQIGETQFVLK